MAATWRLVVPWMRVSAQCCFPAVQIGLGFFQALEAQSFQRSVLGMADAALHLALSIRVADAARQRDGAVVSQQIGVERIERGVVDVGLEHAFAEIVQHERCECSAQPAEGLLVQFGPDARAGCKVSRRTALRL